MTPSCPHCGKPMRLNAPVSNQAVQQFICACRGEVTYVNVHKGQRNRGEMNG